MVFCADFLGIIVDLKLIQLRLIYQFIKEAKLEPCVIYLSGTVCVTISFIKAMSHDALPPRISSSGGGSTRISHT